MKRGKHDQLAAYRYENVFVYLWRIFLYSLQFEHKQINRLYIGTYTIYVLRSLKPKQYLTLGMYNLNTFQT